MNPPDPLPGGLDPQKLAETLEIVRAQVATALWLSAGMLCAFAGIVCAAIHRRRAALFFGFCYSATLCFVPNGHAQIIGPLGGAAAVAGFFWPSRK